MARVTIKDVAHEAGVSQTTVSFVLNGRDNGIPERTRDLVMKAAARLNYVPSAAARTLRSGHSSLVLCLVPPLPVAQATEEFKNHLSGVIAEAGFTCVFAQLTDPSRPSLDIWRHVHPVGVITLASLPTADSTALAQAGIPLVDAAQERERPEDGVLDQAGIGALLVEHLVERGHRRIGFAKLSDPLEFPFVEARLDGVRRACHVHDLPQPVVADLSYTRVSALAALEKWRAEAAGVTAVAAFNDMAAVAIMTSCHATGVRVPDDLALIGVDDLPISSLMEPALSTIALDLRGSARRLANRLLAQLPGAKKLASSTYDVAPMRLIHRGTS
ncbi:LacI family DNA-binding transcriptional regulator [Streptomyces sp. NPDC096311]|uniref:LacI family DNA-binding transcriptional regulator n=1 Tax=Streptomyces sp. NPDC096311 TaxID=3366083 RepID=UPI0037FEE29D